MQVRIADSKALGQLKKKQNLQGCSRDSCGVSNGSWFLTLDFHKKGCLTILQNFQQTGKLVFSGSGISKDKLEKLKIPAGFLFQKKYILKRPPNLSHPSLFFFLEWAIVDSLIDFFAKILKITYLLQGYSGHLYFLCFM